MSGCFGNHPFDRIMEQQLFRHLDSEDDDTCYCPDCHYKDFVEAFEYDEENNTVTCPKCGEIIQL